MEYPGLEVTTHSLSSTSECTPYFKQYNVDKVVEDHEFSFLTSWGRVMFRFEHEG